VLQQVSPGTPVFAPPGTPVDTGIGYPQTKSPNPAPDPTNGYDGPDLLCAPAICGKAGTGAYYVAGFNPPAADPNDWYPAFRLAPLIIFNDPPANDPAPQYVGEAFPIPMAWRASF